MGNGLKDKTGNEMKSFLKTFLIYFGLFILTILLYGNVVHFEYIWDDHTIFIGNTSLISEPLSWKLIAQPVLDGTSYFRPIVFLSWFWEFHFFGQNPAISHAINLFFFYCNILLVYHLVNIFLSSTLYSIIAATLYCLHPMNVEATAWVSGRFDTFVTTFTLAACLSFLKLEHYWWRNFTVWTFVILALGSKEIAIMILPALYFLWMMRHQMHYTSYHRATAVFFKTNKILLLGTLAICISYLFVRKYYASGITHQKLDLNYIKYFYFEANVPIVALKEYISRTILPYFNMGEMFPIPYFTQSLNKLFSWVICFILIAITFIGIKKRSILVYSFLLYLLFISLVLYIIPLTTNGNIIHDRFLTLPLAFYALLFALTLTKLTEKRSDSFQKIVITSAIVYLLSMIPNTYLLVQNWKDSLSFWYATNEYQKKYTEEELEQYLEVLLQKGKDKEIEKFIANERKTHDGALRPTIQMMYGVHLISKGDKEGLMALKGIIDILPKTYKSHKVFEQSNYGMNRQQIYVLYLSYSAGMLLLLDDTKEAKKYMEIANFYKPNYYYPPKLYTEIPVYLADGDYAKVKNLMSELKLSGYFNTLETIKLLEQTLKNYCNVTELILPICQDKTLMKSIFEK